nr:PREDICTED: regucalcin-like [Bemisia tabaci]XP_018908739.1 PREDICTED: regucalcin-like [Bemisia tabaci]
MLPAQGLSFLLPVALLFFQVRALKTTASTIQAWPVTPRLCHLEEPHFDYKKQRLYFADQYGKRACSYDLLSGVTACTSLDQTVGAFAPVKNTRDQFLAVLGPYLVLLFWDGVSAQSTYVILARPESESKYPGNFFNDGKTDVEGRLWVGTEGPALESGPAGRVPNRGNFYSYSTEICGLKREISNVTLSNGLAWNKNNTILYYIDSGTFKVTKLKYDRRTGVISNPETVFDFKANKIPGLLPHGMTIDTEDNLYVAMYGGYRIIKIDPTRGVVLLTINLPIALVTDMRWGGWDLDILFVTSSRMGLNETELEEQPWAGRVIAMTGLNATGCISHEAVICLPGRPDDTDVCSAPS